jgi:preprotein translocase subunit YajC
MNTLALSIGVLYGIITFVSILIIIYLIIRRKRQKKLEDFEQRDN